MPWSGSDFQRNQNFSADASASIGILASRVDDEFNNFETGLEACLKVDGTNAPAADFAMAGFKHTNVGAATSTNHYLRTDQLQQLTPIYAVFAGTAEAISASVSPAPTALVTGHTFIVSCPSANATTSVTMNYCGLSAAPVRLADNTEISLGAVKGLRKYSYRGGYYALLNPPAGGTVATSTNFTQPVVFSGSVTFASAAVFSASASFTSAATIHDGFTQVNIGYRDIPVITIDVGRELTINDRAHQLYHATTSALSITIPSCASVAFPIGTPILIQNGASGGVVSVSAGGGVTLVRVGTGSTGTRILSAACDGLFRKVASDTWFGGGSLI